MKSPISNIQLIPAADLSPNDWNPNTVFPDEMSLLEHSIAQDGFCFPVVVANDPERTGKYIIIDGYHRFTLLQSRKSFAEFFEGKIPCVVIDGCRRDLMAATVRFNRARGSHGAMRMAELVERLLAEGADARWLREALGLTVEEAKRLMQVGGVASALAADDYSAAAQENV